jgi:hypothetical protein
VGSISFVGGIFVAVIIILLLVLLLFVIVKPARFHTRCDHCVTVLIRVIMSSSTEFVAVFANDEVFHLPGAVVVIVAETLKIGASELLAALVTVEIISALA